MNPQPQDGKLRPFFSVTYFAKRSIASDRYVMISKLKVRWLSNSPNGENVIGETFIPTLLPITTRLPQFNIKLFM